MKIDKFLDSALKKEIINKDNFNRLTKFAEISKEKKGFLSLTTSLAFVGIFVLVLGVILIISTNWTFFPPHIKFFNFLFLLVMSHSIGLLLARKSYEKMAQVFHFGGAFLFIAGVGLIAQIFHLHLNTGIVYLLWGVMIAPLSLILKNFSIGILSMISITVWGAYSLSYYRFPNYYTIITIYVLLALLACTFKKYSNFLFTLLIIPSFTVIIISMYFLGFAHHTRPYYNEGSFLLIFPSILLIYLLITYWKEKFLRFLFISIGFSILTLFLLSLPRDFIKGSFSIPNFGRDREIFWRFAFISIFAWGAYFSFVLLGIFYFAFRHQKGLLNFSIFLFGFGIITRFLDLMGSMQNTGLFFILIGVVIILTSFFLEKWRRKIIGNLRGVSQ